MNPPRFIEEAPLDLLVSDLDSDRGVRVPVGEGKVFNRKILSGNERFVFQPGTYVGDGANDVRTIHIPTGAQFEVSEYYPAMQGLIVAILIIGEDNETPPNWDDWSAYQYHWKAQLLEGGHQVMRHDRGRYVPVDTVEIPAFALREYTKDNTVFESLEYHPPCSLWLKSMNKVSNILGTINTTSGYSLNDKVIAIQGQYGVKPDGFQPRLINSEAIVAEAPAHQIGIVDLARSESESYELVDFPVTVSTGSQTQNESLYPVIVRVNGPSIKNSILTDSHWPPFLPSRSQYITDVEDNKVAVFVLYLFMEGDGPVSQLISNTKQVTQYRIDNGYGDKDSLIDDGTGDTAGALYETAKNGLMSAAQTVETSLGTMMLDFITGSASILLGALFAAFKEGRTNETYTSAHSWEQFLSHWSDHILDGALRPLRGDAKTDFEEYRNHLQKARVNAAANGLSDVLPALEFIDLYPAFGADKDGRDGVGDYDLSEDDYVAIRSALEGKTKTLRLKIRRSRANDRVACLKSLDSVNGTEKNIAPKMQYTVGYTEPARQTMHENAIEPVPVWLLFGKSDLAGTGAFSYSCVMYRDRGTTVPGEKLLRTEWPLLIDGSDEGTVDLTDLPFRSKTDAEVLYRAVANARFVCAFDNDVDQIYRTEFDPKPYVGSTSSDSLDTASWGIFSRTIHFSVAPMEASNISVSNPNDPDYQFWSPPLHGSRNDKGAAIYSGQATTGEMFPETDALYTNSGFVARGHVYIVKEPDANIVNVFGKRSQKRAQPIASSSYTPSGHIPRELVAHDQRMRRMQIERKRMSKLQPYRVPVQKPKARRPAKPKPTKARPQKGQKNKGKGKQRRGRSHP